MPQEDRVGTRKDQVEVEIHHRDEDGEHGEQIDQLALDDDLRPVIAPHEGADGDDAEHEEESGRFIVGPLPEDPGTDEEDQQLLQEPDEGPEIGRARGPLHDDARPMDRPRCPVAPANFQGGTDAIAHVSHRPDVIRIADIALLRDWMIADRKQFISFTRAFIPPVVPRRDIFLDARPEHATYADRPHPGYMGKHGDRVEQGQQRAGRARTRGRTFDATAKFARQASWSISLAIPGIG